MLLLVWIASHYYKSSKKLRLSEEIASKSIARETEHPKSACSKPQIWESAFQLAKKLQISSKNWSILLSAVQKLLEDAVWGSYYAKALRCGEIAILLACQSAALRFLQQGSGGDQDDARDDEHDTDGIGERDGFAQDEEREQERERGFADADERRLRAPDALHGQDVEHHGQDGIEQRDNAPDEDLVRREREHGRH